MEERMQIIQAAGNSKIQIGVIPGHYATNHSHINYYVDITSLKTGYKMAKEAAKALAATYVSTHIDTIICLEGKSCLPSLFHWTPVPSLPEAAPPVYPTGYLPNVRKILLSDIRSISSPCSRDS